VDRAPASGAVGRGFKSLQAHFQPFLELLRFDAAMSEINRIPLLEVLLRLEFEKITVPQERFGFLEQILPPDGSESLSVSDDALELRSSRRISFGRLRDFWSTLLESTLNTLEISSLESISLSYLNEIPLQDLRDFQEYLNISIEMPPILKDRIEFFRTEFTYKYDFGEIRVWLQPDWDDLLDGYCIQLNMESRKSGPVPVDDLIPVIDKMHTGLKDVFRQVLSENYVRRLPQ
jgi:uncharacterized protein (TIGR04255 family)